MPESVTVVGFFCNKYNTMNIVGSAVQQLNILKMKF